MEHLKGSDNDNNDINDNDNYNDNDNDDEGCSDWESDDDNPVKSLFSNTVLSNVQELIEYDELNYNFNIKDVAIDIDNHLTDETLIMLINYIRRKVIESNEIDENFLNNLKLDLMKKEFLRDERNMMPTLQEDSLLFSLKNAIDTNKNDNYEDDINDFNNNNNDKNSNNDNNNDDDNNDNPRLEEILTRYHEIQKEMDELASYTETP